MRCPSRAPYSTRLNTESIRHFPQERKQDKWGTLEVLTNSASSFQNSRRRCRAEIRSSKRVFLDSPFLLWPRKVFRCFKGKPQGAEKKHTLQKHPFGQPFLRTTPSPLLWRTPIFAGLSIRQNSKPPLRKGPRHTKSTTDSESLLR